MQGCYPGGAGASPFSGASKSIWKIFHHGFKLSAGPDQLMTPSSFLFISYIFLIAWLLLADRGVHTKRNVISFKSHLCMCDCSSRHLAGTSWEEGSLAGLSLTIVECQPAQNELTCCHTLEITSLYLPWKQGRLPPKLTKHLSNSFGLDRSSPQSALIHMKS